VAHGRRWFAEIRDTKVHSLAELAKRHKVDRTDIGRAISLSFLAPDIVEAFLEGRQPTELTAARLKRMDLPVSWAEQLGRRGLSLGQMADHDYQSNLDIKIRASVTVKGSDLHVAVLSSASTPPADHLTPYHGTDLILFSIWS